MPRNNAENNKTSEEPTRPGNKGAKRFVLKFVRRRMKKKVGKDVNDAESL